MKTDFLILGQGICGTLLSFELLKRNQSFVVINDERKSASSEVASGLINPVTGKRNVKSWFFDELQEAALEAYQELEQKLSISLIRPLDLLKFFRSEEEKNFFFDKAETEKEHLKTRNLPGWNSFFDFFYGYGMIHPCYLIGTQELLNGWKEKLKSINAYRNDCFSWEAFKTEENGIVYKDIKARKIICCEGASAKWNPFFRMLPFSFNKGEALVAAIPDLFSNHIYQHEFKIIPLPDGNFWVGSSFSWNYDSPEPTETFRIKAENFLNKFLKIPFEIRKHIAGERPSSMDYRPFVGFHPLFRNIGILNGMGTKGYSLAPYFARQMAENLASQKPVLPAADIQRFQKILSRNISL